MYLGFGDSSGSLKSAWNNGWVNNYNSQRDGGNYFVYGFYSGAQGTYIGFGYVYASGYGYMLGYNYASGAQGAISINGGVVY